MTYRITDKMLQARVDYLNKITGSPATAYTKTDKGMKANIGHFHIDHAYGGVSLERMMSEGGGVESISDLGHITKRELFNWITAYISGIQFARDQNRGV